MPKLNFYDTATVKAFVLDLLIENKELQKTIEEERNSANNWFKHYQEAAKKVAELEKKTENTKGGSKNEQ